MHSYVSAFIAPTIVFFALSGSLQVLGLHDAHGGYKPNALISSMARLHKNQVFAPEPERGAAPPEGSRNGRGPAPGPQAGRPNPGPTLATRILKGLFFLEALALVATTMLGVWIGVTHPKRARTVWILLAAGALLPVALIVL